MKKETELINFIELESNIDQENRVICPKCDNENIIKIKHQIDLPKTIGFIFFLGASLVLVIIINAIVMLRERFKLSKLHPSLKEKIRNEQKTTLLGLYVPTKLKLSCNKCQYVFYENYDSGDFIIVFIFFILFLLTLLSCIYIFLK